MKLIDGKTCYISEEAVIDETVIIYPNNNIIGKCVIGAGAILKPNNIIEDSIIGEGTEVTGSVLKGAVVGAKCTVGPYAYLRAGSKIGDGCRIGDFVEIKNADIGDGTKVSHLSYVGDADVGAGCNVGCGVVFVNYDGKKKSRTRVGDDCFIGSNSNIIAPVEISEGSYIAAGTTVTDSTPPSSLVIGRVRQEIKENRARGRYRM